MAVDTRQKRLSMLSFSDHVGLLHDPAGSIGLDERVTELDLYQGVFDANTFTGSSSATIGAVTAAASGTFTAPVYTGSSAATTGAVVASATGTFTAPVYTGTSAATIGAVTASASGTFVGGAATYTGTAAIVVPSVTAAGTGILSASIVERRVISASATPNIIHTTTGAVKVL